MYICAETTCLISIGACVGAKSNLANILIKQRSLMIHLIHLLYITMFLHLTHEFFSRSIMMSDNSVGRLD